MLPPSSRDTVFQCQITIQTMGAPHFWPLKLTRLRSCLPLSDYKFHIYMSLFKLKNLWIQSFPQEQFDQRHLCIGKIDQQPAIVLGSFSGSLRVFAINQSSGFHVNLIFQTKFQNPIIDLKFVQHPEQKIRNTIGVVLFRKFVYLSLKKNPQTRNYQQKTLQINTEPAFGLESESLSLMTINESIQYLNPLSIQKLKVSDPIYPFARREDSIYYADGQELVKVQNSSEQWRIIVGPMRKIQLFLDFVVIIGDNALWEVQEAAIKKTKVFDQDISCGTVIDKQNDYNILVANFANQILIYTSNYSLIWAMKANEVPICVNIFNYGNLSGALAILGEQGTVSISYLGSQTAQTQIQPISQQVDMEKVESQIQKMLQQIRNKQQDQQNNQHQEQIQSKGDVRLIVRAKGPKKANQIVDGEQKLYKINGGTWCCDIQCGIKTQKQPIHQVFVSISYPANVTCAKNVQKIASIKGSQIVNFTLMCSCQKFPFSNLIYVTLKYQNADKRRGSNVISQTCQLPLDFQCSFKSLQQQKKQEYSIKLKANSILPPLSQIFPQFDSQLKDSKNLTINLANGIVSSIRYNNENNRIKVQSNFYSGLCYIFVVFYYRFENLVKGKKFVNNQLSTDQIDLQQFFNLMRDHFSLREETGKKEKQLEDRCDQFRNAEKKLLQKLKQKVTSINNMDKLLEYTYQKLISAADSYEQTREQFDAVCHNFEVAIQFVLKMLFMKSKATPKCKQKVLGIIGYQKQCKQFGWQQKVLSNSAHYLNKKYNYTVDKHTFDQLYKTVLWVISKVNSGQWNQ